MKSENIILTKLQADEGMILTDGKSYGKIAYLGANDRAENWHEITEKDYESVQNKKENAE